MALHNLLASETLEQWRVDINQLMVDVDAYQTGASPFALLHVDSNAVYDTSPGSGAGLFAQYDSSNVGYIDAFLANTNTTLSFGTTNSADAIVTERLRIDNNGNFGIGTSDIEAWASTITALEFTSAALAYNDTNKIFSMWSNLYQNETGLRYKTTDEASMIDVSASITAGLALRVFPSGTINTIANTSLANVAQFTSTLSHFNVAGLDVDFQVDYDLGRAFFIDGASGVAQFDNPLIMGANGTEGGEIVFDPGSSETAQTKTFDTASDSFRFHSNAVTLFGVNIDRSAIHYGGLVINEDGLDQDTRIEGSALPNLFHVDAGTNNIGINTGTPQTSSLLDIVSNTKGFLAPRMTSAQRDSIITPATGLLVFNTSDDRFSQNDQNDNWDNLATIGDVETIGAVINSGHIDGLQLSINGTDIENDIDIAIGECVNTGETDTMTLSSLLTKEIDAVWVAGSGNGGLMSGTVQANTWYHVFLIKNTTTDVVDAGFDVDIDATNLLATSGYHIYRRIGSVRRGATANLLFLHKGDHFIYADPQLDLDGALSTTRTFKTLTVPPDIEVFAKVNYSVRNVAVGPTYVLLQNSNGTDSVPSATVYSYINEQTNSGGYQSQEMNILTDTSRNISERSSVANNRRLFTLGYEDFRGKK